MSGPLDALLRPRSIAVIGASNRLHSLGGMVTDRLFQAGFTGAIYPVNPKQDAIHSTKAYPSLTDVPDEVDMAIIVVPRDAVLPAARECCEKGVKAAVVVTSGFKEADEEGAALERELTELFRSHGVRFIGPNCMGVFNTSEGVRLDATFSPTPPLAGPLGFASQSGALGVVVLNMSRDRKLGFSHFVSMGNKSDVDESDLIATWEDDDEVPVITAYLESFTDATRFLESARRVTRKKPIVLLKAGKTAAGAKAASSHTGALAAADTGTDALCRQAGVTRVETVEDLLDTGLVLSRCPLPRGPRVCVLTNAGGPGIMAVDKICELGLEMAELSDDTRAKLGEMLPPQASTANPVDVLPSASPDDFAACVKLIAADPGVDAVISITVTPPLFSALATLRAISPAARAAEKPVLTVFMVTGEFGRKLDEVKDPPPIFAQPENAARALAHAWDYASHLATPAGEVADPEMDHDAIDALLSAKLEKGGGYLDADATFRVLELAGLPVAPWRVCPDADAAAEAAEAIGFPVVVKAAGEALVHKSDVGGVALGIEDEDALRAALDHMSTSIGAAGHAAGSWEWLVQAMRPGGREVILGANRDPAFGPLVMFGLGGKYVEVFRDVRFAMAPMTAADARALVEGIRGLKLLTGTRGESGVALDPAVDGLTRLAALVRRHPAIAELDVNPLLLFPEAGRAVVVDGRIRVEG